MSNQKKRIMLVEDAQDFAEIVGDYLIDAGYLVDIYHTGIGIVDRVKTSPPDLLLLDLMLPGTSGTDICEAVRHFSNLPVVMLTAKINEIDRLVGYDLGVDDYICKPVSPKEILARVKAVLRRFDPSSLVHHQSALEFDIERHLVKIKGTPLDLTRMEFLVLQLISKKEGRVFSRTQILDHLYEDDVKSNDRSTDTHIKNLRKKISAAYDGPSPIQSVYGIGYKFEWPE